MYVAAAVLGALLAPVSPTAGAPKTVVATAAMLTPVM